MPSTATALPYVAEKDTALGRWAKSLLSRAHQNVAVDTFFERLDSLQLLQILPAPRCKSERFSLLGQQALAVISY
jgi:hypothetical protein